MWKKTVVRNRIIPLQENTFLLSLLKYYMSLPVTGNPFGSSKSMVEFMRFLSYYTSVWSCSYETLWATVTNLHSMVWHPPLTNIHTLPLSFQSPFCSSIFIQDPTSTMMIFGKGIQDDDLFRRHERNLKASERVSILHGTI